MDLMFYPDSEQAPHRDKPKGAYVHFKKIFRHHQPGVRSAEGAEEMPEYLEKEEDFYFDISGTTSLENVTNIITHQNAMPIGFGNFPRKAPYGEIARHLMEKTALAYDNPNSSMRKLVDSKIRPELEAQVRAELEAEAEKKAAAEKEAQAKAEAEKKAGKQSKE